MCVCASLVNTWFDPWLVDASGVNRVCKPSCNVFVAGAPTFPVQKRKHSTCPLLNCMILHHRFVGYCWLVSSRLRKQQLFEAPNIEVKRKITRDVRFLTPKITRDVRFLNPPLAKKSSSSPWLHTGNLLEVQFCIQSQFQGHQVSPAICKWAVFKTPVGWWL